MKKFFQQTLIVTLALLFFGACSTTSKETSNRTISFDEGWRFIKDSLAGAENTAFDDSGWRLLNVPHDWSIEDLPGQNGNDIIGPFDKSSVDKMSSGYLVGGTGWYRKTFITSEMQKDKVSYLRFDGVYMNSDVWLNGQHLGFHPYGYTPFIYEITKLLNPVGQPNVIAVRVANTGLNSRWYSGSGINRHVWLTVTDPVHIDVSGGIYVTTPVVSENSAEVKIVTNVTNSGIDGKDLVLLTELKDPSGRPAGKTESTIKMASGQCIEIQQNIKVDKPELWSTDDPNLYSAKVSILSENNIIDSEETTFGIRSISIDASNGLLINGKAIDLIGGCYHHDNGPLGAASIDRAEERKIEILKQTGFNAVRTSHNPPSPALLDACDRLGMVVIDEIFDMWETSKKEQDYHFYFRDWWQKDIESWVKRDRNHPSVILWSIGNEIRETFDTSGSRIAGNLCGEIRRFDNTRGITEAFNDFAARRGQPSRWDSIPEHMALLNVVGYNYMYNRYENDHEKYPDRVMIGSETNPPLALENYELVKKHPYVIGYFVWTATDNIGEAGVGMPQLRDISEGSQTPSSLPPSPEMPRQQRPLAVNPAAQPATPNNEGFPGGPAGGGFFRRDTWPVYTNYQGDIDIIGNRKVPSYYQHVVWGKSKVEMFVHRPIPEGKREVTSRWGFPDELKSWNWEGFEGDSFLVHVYTRANLVKIELNGKIIGEQKVEPGKSITAAFKVSYEAGTLTARCYDNGKETASETLRTTGKPSAVRLVADRTKIKSDPNDLSYVRAEIIDSNGNIVPDADEIMVNFKVTGTGRIAGVGSGNPRDISSFQNPMKKAYQGICLAVVRPESAGKINVVATAIGLKEGSVIITAK